MQGNSHKLHHLLPEERCIHYDMRRENKYPLTKNRTNRYGKSLIPWGLNFMNDFVMSVSDHLPRLDKDDDVFTVHEELPDEFIISVDDTVSALRKVKTNKSTGPDNITAWVLKEHADCLAAPLASIFNCSLREGVLPNVWKSANIIPLPKTKPLMSVKTDIRPISITPIAAKVFESIIMKYVDDIVCDTIDSKQFGGIAGTSTTDALVEMTHRW